MNNFRVNKQVSSPPRQVGCRHINDTITRTSEFCTKACPLVHFCANPCTHPKAIAVLSETNHFRLMRECTDGGCGVSEIEYLRVPIVRRIHLLQGRISVQHRLPCIHPVVFDKLSGNANPFTVFECANFSFWIRR